MHSVSSSLWSTMANLNEFRRYSDLLTLEQLQLLQITSLKYLACRKAEVAVILEDGSTSHAIELDVKGGKMWTADAFGEGAYEPLFVLRRGENQPLVAARLSTRSAITQWNINKNTSHLDSMLIAAYLTCVYSCVVLRNFNSSLWLYQGDVEFVVLCCHIRC